MEDEEQLRIRLKQKMVIFEKNVLDKQGWWRQGLNKEIQLILCKIFSILIFNEFCLFA